MINGIGNNSPVQKIVSQPIQKQLPAEPPKQLRAMDRLEVSAGGSPAEDDAEPAATCVWTSCRTSSSRSTPGRTNGGARWMRR